jgi:AGZA family xanthine/uracil permease-like MFS transporter
MLERLFELEKHGTSVRTELVAGLTTFMTMAYIIFVNPAILADAGMDKGAVFVATCLAAAFASAFMGLYANYPVALAPGMGLNAYFTYGVVKGLGHSWETALGAVFLSGILFLIVSLTPIREWVINSIPRSLKMAIAAGIGLFLAIIGLQSAGIIKAHPATLVTLGDLKSPTVLLAALGLILMGALDTRRVPGAILIGILAQRSPAWRSA